uniref:Ixodegrin B n=1 Tax=Rhipicephalus appendiculatus TaxID=34631 RepID=A0A131Z3X5_RHIAP
MIESHAIARPPLRINTASATTHIHKELFMEIFYRAHMPRVRVQLLDMKFILLALVTFVEKTECGKNQGNPHGPPDLSTVVFASIQGQSPPSPQSVARGRRRSRSPLRSGSPHSGRKQVRRPSRPRGAIPGACRRRRPSSPQYVVPGETQIGFAKAEHRYFLPKHLIRYHGQSCSVSTICDDGMCCLDLIQSKTCQCLSNRGEPCSVRTLGQVYFRHCPCGLNQGTCEDGICT